ncbi:MAG: hypothetical protein M0R80_01075 [Proteobacteria bacterium]|jgi:hypothetical protein|nr:hypothetical protein [Pseudomonadota bacterium]
MDDTLLALLKGLPKDQLQSIIDAGQKLLGTPKDHRCHCEEEDGGIVLTTGEEEREIPENVMDELRELWSDTQDTEYLTITYPTELEVQIDCNGHSGDFEEDIELDINVNDMPDAADILRDNKEVKKAADALHAKMEKFLNRAQAVADEYGKDVDDIIDEF